MTPQEAIEIMSKVTFYWELGEQTLTQNQINKALDMAIKALESQRWIPVSERLPEERNHYLITVEIDGMNGCKPYYEIQTSWYSDGQFVVEYIGGLVAKKSVIAWMPLPTSYQGEKNG